MQEIITEENKKNIKQDKEELTKYKYPDEVISSTTIGQLSNNGVEFKLKKEDCYFIRELECQKEYDKGLFGSGYLISKAKAEEIAKAKKIKKAKEEDKTFRWELSDNEKAIVEGLGSNGSK